MEYYSDDNDDFGKRIDPPPKRNTSLIEKDKIVGEVYFQETAEVWGQIEGLIISKGKLKIKESALIKGDIKGEEIIISGKVEGNIEAAKSLALKSPAQIIGNVKTPVISMEEGVLFQGECKMDHSPSK